MISMKLNSKSRKRDDGKFEVLDVKLDNEKQKIQIQIITKLQIIKIDIAIDNNKKILQIQKILLRITMLQKKAEKDQYA